MHDRENGYLRDAPLGLCASEGLQFIGVHFNRGEYYSDKYVSLDKYLKRKEIFEKHPSGFAHLKGYSLSV